MTEILFLGGFVVFIAAILVLDMLVIDRKAHVVSIKEAGTWTGVWIGLALLFSVFLWFHGDMVHGIENMHIILMENIENTKSGFKVESILLTESQFSRKGNIDFSNSKQEVSFETGVGTKGSVVNVKLTTTVTNKLQDEVQYKIEVTMVGVFKRNGESEIKDNEEFGRVNGAAIIFPFVREHIANIALKAGLGSIILPPVNFTKVNKDKTSNK